MSEEGSVGGVGHGGDGGIETVERACASLVRELRQTQTELAEREGKVKREEEDWRAKRQALDEERYVLTRIGAHTQCARECALAHL